jgi:hypothetical protein
MPVRAYARPIRERLPRGLGLTIATGTSLLMWVAIIASIKAI